MKAPPAPWRARAWQDLARPLAAGRLGHALLLTGAPRLGKRVLAEALAKALLCERRDAEQHACGSCRQCQAFERRYQTDPVETRPDGSLAHPQGLPGHPDARIVGYTFHPKTERMRVEIAVDQIRELSAWFALTPRQAGVQVALLEPADALNRAASNALLKTLEEPLPGRYLILVSARSAALPATIRSRCQRFELRLPAPDEADAWLAAQGHAAAERAEALALADGHPGLALDILQEGGLALRDEVRNDLSSLAAGAASPHAVAARWAQDRPATRLALAADAVRAHGRRQFAPRGRGEAILSLTAAAEFPKLAAWFDEANRVRGLLDAPLRGDLLLTGLLCGWQQATSPAALR